MSVDKHYKEQGIDTIKRAKANLSLVEQKAICIFNIDRYLWREKGQNLDDVTKIMAYTKWLREIELKTKNQIIREAIS